MYLELWWLICAMESAAESTFFGIFGIGGILINFFLEVSLGDAISSSSSGVADWFTCAWDDKLMAASCSTKIHLSFFMIFFDNSMWNYPFPDCENRTFVILIENMYHVYVPQIVLESKLWINSPETPTSVVWFTGRGQFWLFKHLTLIEKSVFCLKQVITFAMLMIGLWPIKKS